MNRKLLTDEDIIFDLISQIGKLDYLLWNEVRHSLEFDLCSNLQPLLYSQINLDFDVFGVSKNDFYS